MAAAAAAAARHTAKCGAATPTAGRQATGSVSDEDGDEALQRWRPRWALPFGLEERPTVLEAGPAAAAGAHASPASAASDRRGVLRLASLQYASSSRSSWSTWEGSGGVAECCSSGASGSSGGSRCGIGDGTGALMAGAHTPTWLRWARREFDGLDGRSLEASPSPSWHEAAWAGGAQRHGQHSPERTVSAPEGAAAYTRSPKVLVRHRKQRSSNRSLNSALERAAPQGAPSVLPSAGLPAPPVIAVVSLLVPPEAAARFNLPAWQAPASGSSAGGDGPAGSAACAAAAEWLIPAAHAATMQAAPPAPGTLVPAQLASDSQAGLLLELQGKAAAAARGHPAKAQAALVPAAAQEQASSFSAHPRPHRLEARCGGGSAAARRAPLWRRLFCVAAPIAED